MAQCLDRIEPCCLPRRKEAENHPDCSREPEGEGHDALERVGWSMVKWKTSGGYASQDSVGKVNAKRERIWFSPACVKPAPTLFEDKP